MVKKSQICVLTAFMCQHSSHLKMKGFNWNSAWRNYNCKDIVLKSSCRLHQVDHRVLKNNTNFKKFVWNKNPNNFSISNIILYYYNFCSLLPVLFKWRPSKSKIGPTPCLAHLSMKLLSYCGQWLFVAVRQHLMFTL